MTAARKQWTEDHQRQLKAARLRTGVSDVAFARDNAIALRHLQQLEEGGTSAFYSESIKYDMGAKLLKRLGVEPYVALAAPVTTAPDLPRAATEPTAFAVDTATSAAAPSDTPPAVAVAQTTASTHVPYIVLTLVGVGLIGAGISWIPSIHPPGATQGVVHVASTAPATPAVPPASPAMEASAQEGPAGQSASGDKAAAIAVAASPGAPAQGATGESCQVNGASQTVVPSQPSKSADYVYVTAVSDASVCVRDAAGQVTRKSLQAGQSVNIPGQQPFDLTADNLSQLRVFFQGQRIWFQAEATRLRLTAATASD